MTIIEEKKENEPKVSVIITFYNLGKYAINCLKSLLMQDYHNCEFICIDDGSTDETTSILGKYSQDERIKIFHKKNGGLSDARNFGLNIATGEYITIIDGDDYIHPQYLSLLVKAIEGNHDRIVISPLRVVKYKESMDVVCGWDNEVTTEILDKKETFIRVLYNELSTSACGKLVPREVYNDIRFPVGKVSEEVATIGSLISKFDVFVVIKQPLYGYVMRAGSIGHEKGVAYKAIQDRIDAMEQFETVIRQEYEIDNDKSLNDALKYRWGYRFVDMATMYDRVTDDKAAMCETKNKVKKWLKENVGQIIHNRKAPFAQRLRMLLYTYFPRLYIFLYSNYQNLKYHV